MMLMMWLTITKNPFPYSEEKVTFGSQTLLPNVLKAHNVFHTISQQLQEVGFIISYIKGGS